MSSCLNFPVHEADTTMTSLLDYAATPACYATGLLGCLTAVVIVNRPEMRKESPVYVFLGAIAALDLLSLLSRLPSAFRQIELFDLGYSYSFYFTLISTVSAAVYQASTHSCYWLLAFCLIVNYSNQPDVSKRKAPKWTRISAARILAFLNILFTCLIDVPSFVELRVQLVENHCFAGMELYMINRTEIHLSSRIQVGGLFTYWYPNIQMISLVAIPVFLIIIFALVTLLLSAAARGRMPDSSIRPVVIARRPLDQDERRSQLNSCLVATSLSFLVLRLPYHLCRYYYSEWFALRDAGSSVSNMPYHLATITSALYVVSIAIQFLIHTTMNNDFLMCFKRTFCFLCKAGDTYVETPSLMGCCCKDKNDDIDFSLVKTPGGATLDRCGASSRPSKTPYATVQYRHDIGPLVRRYDQQLFTPEDRTLMQQQQQQQQQYPQHRRSASYASRSLPRRPAPRRLDRCEPTAGPRDYETLTAVKGCRKGAIRTYRSENEDGEYGGGVMNFDDLPVGGYAAATMGRGRSRHHDGRGGRGRRASETRAKSIVDNTSSDDNDRRPIVRPVLGTSGRSAGVRSTSVERRSRSRSTEPSSTRSEIQTNNQHMEQSKPAVL